MELNLPEDEFDTISSLVLSFTGEIPRVGHEVKYESVGFCIEKISDKRMFKIKITINT